MNSGEAVTFECNRWLDKSEDDGAIERELERWMEERDYESVEQLKGSVSQAASPDPEAFERANYVRILEGYRNPYLGI